MSHPVNPDPDSTLDPDDRTTSFGAPSQRDDDAVTRSYDTHQDETYRPAALPAHEDVRPHADTTRAPRVVDRTERISTTPDRDQEQGRDRDRDRDRDEVPDLLTQEKAEFGGVKFGSALLGWLTTVGTIVVLAAILAAVATGMNLDSNTSSSDLSGVGLGAAIALLVVLFLGYLAGGYVAGRMARFHGVRQGIAVWLWGVIIAIALSITAAIVGSQSTILVQANLPQIPFTSSGFTWQAILALVAVLLVTLLGAILGGLLGMRFHRRIDRFAAATVAN